MDINGCLTATPWRIDKDTRRMIICQVNLFQARALSPGIGNFSSQNRSEHRTAHAHTHTLRTAFALFLSFSLFLVLMCYGFDTILFNRSVHAGQQFHAFHWIRNTAWRYTQWNSLRSSCQTDCGTVVSSYAKTSAKKLWILFENCTTVRPPVDSHLDVFSFVYCILMYFT